MRQAASIADQRSTESDPRPPLVGLDAGGFAVGERWQPRANHRYRGPRLQVKRVVDLVGSFGLLMVSLPLMALIAVAIRLSSDGPALFRQARVGRDGEAFVLCKFRTMHLDAEDRLRQDPDLHRRYIDGGFKLSLDEDPRIARFGTFLRKSSLDELPQLLNVLRGEMSLVGPRPVLPEELHQYEQFVDAYLMAAPGLTGPWQVSGRDAVRFPGRAHFDADYIDNWSLVEDAKILARTLPAVAAARGVE